MAKQALSERLKARLPEGRKWLDRGDRDSAPGLRRDVIIDALLNGAEILELDGSPAILPKDELLDGARAALIALERWRKLCGITSEQALASRFPFRYDAFKKCLAILGEEKNG